MVVLRKLLVLAVQDTINLLELFFPRCFRVLLHVELGILLAHEWPRIVLKRLHVVSQCDKGICVQAVWILFTRHLVPSFVGVGKNEDCVLGVGNFVVSVNGLRPGLRQFRRCALVLLGVQYDELVTLFAFVQCLLGPLAYALLQTVADEVLGYFVILVFFSGAAPWRLVFEVVHALHRLLEELLEGRGGQDDALVADEGELFDLVGAQ